MKRLNFVNPMLLCLLAARQSLFSAICKETLKSEFLEDDEDFKVAIWYSLHIRVSALRSVSQTCLQHRWQVNNIS
ncbi:hypothetical protein K439DRAFT_554593 [Ramaria rubella]|nr:hypothetical protein K439DRAFT_554593 [Ramaria rubella]